MSPAFREIELPWPPPVNRCWRAFQSRIILTREAREYREAVCRAGLMASALPIAGPVIVDIRLYRPRRIGDIDGPLKPLLDALTHAGLWLDDSQVEQLRVTRLDDKENPRVDISVSGERWATAEEAANARIDRATAGQRGKRTRAVNRASKRVPKAVPAYSPATPPGGLTRKVEPSKKASASSGGGERGGQKFTDVGRSATRRPITMEALLLHELDEAEKAGGER